MPRGSVVQLSRSPSSIWSIIAAGAMPPLQDHALAGDVPACPPSMRSARWGGSKEEFVMIEVTLAPGSPFVRKVRIIAAMKGLGQQVEFLHAEKDAARSQALRAANPLRQGAGGAARRRQPAGRQHGDLRVPRQSEAVAAPDPCIGAGALACVVARCAGRRHHRVGRADRLREAIPAGSEVAPGVDRQAAGQGRQGGRLSGSNVPDWKGTPDYGHIALACALGYLDLRQDGRWRKTAPKLAQWLARFEAAVPSFAETAPPTG